MYTEKGDQRSIGLFILNLFGVSQPYPSLQIRTQGEGAGTRDGPPSHRWWVGGAGIYGSYWHPGQRLAETRGDTDSDIINCNS